MSYWGGGEGWARGRGAQEAQEDTSQPGGGGWSGQALRSVTAGRTLRDRQELGQAVGEALCQRLPIRGRA